MKQRINILLILLPTLIGCLSCEKEIDWTTQVVNPDRIVVDAIFTSEYKAHEVILSYTTDTLNATPKMVSGAQIVVHYNNGSYSFTESSIQPGHYFSEIFSANSSTGYMLAFEVDGFRDSAVAQMAAIESLAPLQIEPSDSLFRYLFNEDAPCMLEVYYDWSHNPAFSFEYGRSKAKEVFYNLDNIDVSKIFVPDKKRLDFPKGTTITRKKYSLSVQHQEFLRHLLLETEWNGGMFDVEPGNVPSNFVNGSLGYFAVCKIISETSVY